MSSIVCLPRRSLEGITDARWTFQPQRRVGLVTLDGVGLGPDSEYVPHGFEAEPDVPVTSLFLASPRRCSSHYR